MKEKKSLTASPEKKRSGKVKRSDAKVVKIRTRTNRTAIVKTVFTLLLVFLQLGLIISLNLLFITGWQWYVIPSFAISVITAVFVLSSHRSTQSKAVWVLFILLFSGCGFLIYILSNDKVMYVRSRRKHREIYKKTQRFVPPYADPNADLDLIKNCRYLYKEGGFVPYCNTRLQYYPSAAATFDDVIEKLKSAEKFVFIEFFAVSDGVLLERILRILEDKMKNGLDVRIIYDDLGSRDLSRKTKKRIKRCGGKIKVFNRLVSRFTFALNYRDHRKIIVIDGKIAYTGGCNLADEYVNEKRMHGYWKDAGLRLEGEAVDAMTLIFLRQWEYIVKKPVEYERFINLYERFENSSTVMPFATGPEFERVVYKAVLENVISTANERLYFMTPYFVPDESILLMIGNAAMSGVDVRLVLPEVPDKAYVYVMTKDNAEKLIKLGVKIYYVKDAFVHSKVVLTEKCALVGSANIDMRSFYQQFEDMVITDDISVMRDVLADFENTFPDCVHPETAEKHGLIKGTVVKALRIVSPLM